MTKAIPVNLPRQAVVEHSAVSAGFSGPSFWTPHCGYSVVQGILFDHVNGVFWFPDEPLFFNTWTDYGPVVRDIREARRVLLRELREAVSPRRKRLIRAQRAALSGALLLLVPFDEICGGASQWRVPN